MRIRDESLSSAVGLLHRNAMAREPLAVHLCNAFTLTLAAEDKAYADALDYRSANLPDGVPVSWFGRWQTGRPRQGPVRGPALMREALCQHGFTHFLLGGSDEVLVDLTKAAMAANRDVCIVGTHAPEFGPVTEEDVRRYSELIRASGANIVWVGLGTPKQDVLLAALVDRVDAVLVGVGAAFDFLSHRKKEAPRFLHGTGLEWLHRLLSEPRRLWRRYLIGNTRFVAHAIGEMRRGRASR